MKNILIAIPTNKYIEPETFKSIYDLTVPAGYKTHFQFFYGYQVDQIRNLIADWARHYDYLFSVDSDIIVPQDALVKMLEADKDVISGLYIQRKPGQHILEIYEPISVIRHGQNVTKFGHKNVAYEDIAGKGIVKVSACGFGCCLIKSDVFRALDYPHFVYHSALNHEQTLSEDIYFCDKAVNAGFSIWADTSILCDHIGQTKFTVAPLRTHIEQIADQDLLPAAHAQYLKTMNIKPKVVYDIGACVLHWTRKAKEVWPNAQYFLFDAAESSRQFFQRSGDSWYIGVLSNFDNTPITFYEDVNNPGGNSYYKETTGHYTEEHAVQKTAWTLDTVVSYNKWPYPDLIKMDIQGAELDVLKGADACLEHATDIILEAQHVDYNEGAPKVEEIVAYLNTKGFRLVVNFCKGEVDGDYHFTRM
jgi:FkbM family methyltransferase